MESVKFGVELELVTGEEMKRRGDDSHWRYFLVAKGIERWLDCGDKLEDFLSELQPIVASALEKLEQANECPFKVGDWARSTSGRLVQVLSEPEYIMGDWMAQVKLQNLKRSSDRFTLHPIGEWKKGDWIKGITDNRPIKVGEGLLLWVNEHKEDFVVATPEFIRQHENVLDTTDSPKQTEIKLVIKNINKRLNALEDRKNDAQTGVCAKAVPAIICEICRSNYPNKHQKRGYETGS